MAGGQVPRKGKHEHGGGPKKVTPKKGRTDKFCKWCKAVDGPFTTHNTTECRRFNKDGSQKDRPINSLTAMVLHRAPLFYELLWCV